MAAAGGRHHRRGTAAVAGVRLRGVSGAPPWERVTRARAGRGPRGGWRAAGGERTALRVRRDVVGRALPGERRRRPAQVFYGVPNRWDVGMSKPNAFTCSATPRQSSRGGRIRTFRSRSRREPLAPGTPCARTRPCDDPGRDRPSVRLGAGLARARERPTRTQLLRHRVQIVNRKVIDREIASRASGLPRAGARARSAAGARGARPVGCRPLTWGIAWL